MSGLVGNPHVDAIFETKFINIIYNNNKNVKVSRFCTDIKIRKNRRGLVNGLGTSFSRGSLDV